MARLGFNAVRLGMTWGGLEPAPRRPTTLPSAPGAPEGPGAVQPGHLQPVRAAAQDDRQPARTLPHLHHPRHAPGRVQPACSTARARRTGRCAPTACRAWTPRAAGPSSTPPRPLASPSTTSGPTTSWATSRGSTTASGVTWPASSVGTRWILGFDPFNEPFSTSLIRVGGEHFDAQLECFYTGTAHLGVPPGCAGDPVSQARPGPRGRPDDPRQRPQDLIFDEPDNYSSRGYPPTSVR